MLPYKDIEIADTYIIRIFDENIDPIELKWHRDKEVEFRGNYETDGFIFVRQTQPLPLTILSLYPELITND